jgi:hypothetical protein
LEVLLYAIDSAVCQSFGEGQPVLYLVCPNVRPLFAVPILTYSFFFSRECYLRDLRANWAGDRTWEPRMDEKTREALFSSWKKAVARSFDWVE